MKNILVVVSCLLSVTIGNTQSVGIGTDSPDSSAILDLTNPDHKGLLIPSMTTSQKNAIEDPADGLLVYQLDSVPGFYSFDGTAWQRVGRGGNAWEETDSTVYTSKRVGIGNSSPDTSAILDLSNAGNKGILIPSMTTAEKDANEEPADGLLVYQTDSIRGFYFFDGIAWGRIGGGGNAWEETDSTVYTSKFVGVNTDEPDNHLDVHGNMVITQPTFTTASAPTPAQTKTMINNLQIIFSTSDSTGRIFDPGGPNGQYGANISNSTCQIHPNGNYVGIELIIEQIDLGVGDSLIIRYDSNSGDIAYSLGHQNSHAGVYKINATGMHLLFKSDASPTTLGDGFSLLFNRMFPDTIVHETKGFAGHSLIYNAVKGSLNGGSIQNNSISGHRSFSFGNKNKAEGTNSIALGSTNLSTGPGSVTMGAGNEANSNYATAIGYSNVAGTESVAMGSDNMANATNSVAIGELNNSTGNNSVSMGSVNSATALNSVAIGKLNTSTGENSVSIGSSNNTADDYAMAFGYDNSASGYFSMALGFNNQTSYGETFSIGSNNNSTGYRSLTIGSDNDAIGDFSCAIGRDNIATGSGSFSIGNLNETQGSSSKAFGTYTVASGSLSETHGYYTQSRGYSGMSIGMYNSPILTTPQTSVTEDTPLFIIGNGNSTSDRSNAMVVRKDGNVGLGTNNPRITLHVADGTDAGLGDTDGFVLIGNANGINMVMDDNEIMARNNGAISDLFLQHDGGNVLIGTGSPGYLLEVNGAAGKPGGGSWTNSSDIRLKQRIQNYEDGLQSLLHIQPIRYHYTSVSGFDTAPEYVGVVAQELQTIAPYMVSVSDKVFPDGSTGYLEVDNSAMTYMLINAVKELHAEIENLKSEIKELRKEK